MWRPLRKKIRQLHVLCSHNHVDEYSMWKIMVSQMAMTLINNLISRKCFPFFSFKRGKKPQTLLGKMYFSEMKKISWWKCFFQEISVSFIHSTYCSHEKRSHSNSSLQEFLNQIYLPFFPTSHFCKNWKLLYTCQVILICGYISRLLILQSKLLYNQ